MYLVFSSSLIPSRTSWPSLWQRIAKSRASPKGSTIRRRMLFFPQTNAERKIAITDFQDHPLVSIYHHRLGPFLRVIGQVDMRSVSIDTDDITENLVDAIVYQHHSSS